MIRRPPRSTPFPTRRSSDLDRLVDPPRPALVIGEHAVGLEDLLVLAGRAELGLARHIVDLLAHFAEGGIDPRALGLDRKSTRLNSSHLVISYAVFCLKKKKL